jgi:pyruvate dehydrogenase E2 component (dihydrolipoamide acetyltransferase)
MLADHMTASQGIPSVSIFAQWNVESLMTWREELVAASGSDGARVTVSHLMIYLVARALIQHPYLNATIEDDEIHLLEDINIGVAVALPDGNLVVPVIRDAQRKSIPDVAAEFLTLTNDARAGHLRPKHVRGATFTITNVGILKEALWQTPLVPASQSAILAIGSIRQAPVVRDGILAVGQVLGASLSFDHRIVSGIPAAQFLATIGGMVDGTILRRTDLSES